MDYRIIIGILIYSTIISVIVSLAVTRAAINLSSKAYLRELIANLEKIEPKNETLLRIIKTYKEL